MSEPLIDGSATKMVFFGSLVDVMRRVHQPYGHWVHDRTVDLSIFLRNCTIAGGLQRMFGLGIGFGCRASLAPEREPAWPPNTQGVAAP